MERQISHSANRVVSKPISSEWMRSSQYVTVRDGTRLAIDIYRPMSAGKAIDKRVPVILSATPYLRADEKDGEIVPGFVDQPLFEALLARGYAIAILDLRGTERPSGRVWQVGYGVVANENAGISTMSSSGWRPNPGAQGKSAWPDAPMSD